MNVKQTLYTQPRSKSKIMITGMVLLVTLLLKNIAGIEVPNEVVDTIIEAVLAIYIAYAVGNNPSIKGDY